MIRETSSAGLADEATGAHGNRDDTLFHVYSVTKAVLATTLHIQAERGLIDYDAARRRLLAGLCRQRQGATTVRDVLTHRSARPDAEDSTPADLPLGRDGRAAGGDARSRRRAAGASTSR